MPIFKKKRAWSQEVETYEIFLDAQNLPKFNKNQFEGRLEKPISKKSLILLGVSFVIIGVVFAGRLGSLQIAQGAEYLELSERNTLNKKIIFAERGVIYDRKGERLAWNEKDSEESDFARRAYIDMPGFAHVLGFVSYPAKDRAGFYWQEEYIGEDGIEKQYDEKLSGKNGLKLFEVDVYGEVQSENVVIPPEYGETVHLSVDAGVQGRLHKAIADFARNYQFAGGSGIIMDIENGEVISLTNYPEYDPEIMSLKSDKEKISGYFSDKRKPFLNRAVSGLYTPGSIVKPFFAVAALNEKIIDPSKQIFSKGYIEIPNPYFPEIKNIFRDWKAHGWVDMREAIAQSSDVYFYAIGGGFEDQKGLGISNIEKYSRLFGLGEKTGIDLPAENYGTIPTPEWKLIHFAGDPWRLGDTYNTSIGQYGFQTTLLEMVRATAALSNGGRLVSPRLVLSSDLSTERPVNIPAELFAPAKEGMRRAVTDGTASRLYLPFVKVAAKTGTAQIGAAKDRVNSWVVGFFPYDNPRYAFAVMMESGPAANTVSSSLVLNELFYWMNENTPEYF